MVFLPPRARTSYTSVHYSAGDFLVFGNETAGLADSFHREYKDRQIRIPINNENVRSLNLANAVAVAVYEAHRQNP